MRLLLGFLMLLGCAPSLPPSLVEGVDVASSAPAGASLLVRGGAGADVLGEGSVFLPVEFDEAGLDGWSSAALLSAGYRIAVVEFEDIVEYAPARDLGPNRMNSCRGVLPGAVARVGLPCGAHPCSTLVRRRSSARRASGERRTWRWCRPRASSTSSGWRRHRRSIPTARATRTTTSFPCTSVGREAV